MTPKDLWSVTILHELSGLLNAIGYLSRFPDPGHALVWLPVNTVDSDHGFQGSFLALLHPPVTKCEISLNLSPQLSVFLHAFFLSPSISPISLISPTHSNIHRTRPVTMSYPDHRTYALMFRQVIPTLTATEWRTSHFFLLQYSIWYIIAKSFCPELWYYEAHKLCFVI